MTPGQEPEAPVLRITDIIPQSEAVRFATWDPDRIWALDLDAYRKYLKTGADNLAHFRALDVLRPRSAACVHTAEQLEWRPSQSDG